MILPFEAFPMTTQVLPQFYWNVVSEEQRMKEICKKLWKTICWVECMRECINKNIETVDNHEIRLSGVEDSQKSVVEALNNFSNYINSLIQYIQQQVNDLKVYVDQKDAALAQDIADLRAYVDAQDAILHQYVDDEVAACMLHCEQYVDAAVAILDARLTQVEGDLTQEILDRIAGDAALQTLIDTINSYIPTTTSVTNMLVNYQQLVDYVSQHTGHYLSPTAAANSTFADQAALDAGPWYYNGQSVTPTNNDYACIEDSTGSYIWFYQQTPPAAGQWAYGYQLGMSFNSDQWAAINSGITSAVVQRFNNWYVHNVATSYNATERSIYWNQAREQLATGTTATPMINKLRGDAINTTGNGIEIHQSTAGAQNDFTIKLAANVLSSFATGLVQQIGASWGTATKIFTLFRQIRNPLNPSASLDDVVKFVGDAPIELSYSVNPATLHIGMDPNTFPIVKRFASAAAFPATGNFNSIYWAINEGRAYIWNINGYSPLEQSRVLRAANQAGFPATGQDGWLYIAADTDHIWYWNGSGYTDTGTTQTPQATKQEIAAANPQAVTIPAGSEVTIPINQDFTTNASVIQVTGNAFQVNNTAGLFRALKFDGTIYGYPSVDEIVGVVYCYVNGVQVSKFDFVNGQAQQWNRMSVPVIGAIPLSAGTTSIQFKTKTFSSGTNSNASNTMTNGSITLTLIP